jgi:hypothetical protein
MTTRNENAQSAGLGTVQLPDGQPRLRGKQNG